MPSVHAGALLNLKLYPDKLYNTDCSEMYLLIEEPEISYLAFDYKLKEYYLDMPYTKNGLGQFKRAKKTCEGKWENGGYEERIE